MTNYVFVECVSQCTELLDKTLLEFQALWEGLWSWKTLYCISTWLIAQSFQFSKQFYLETHIFYCKNFFTFDVIDLIWPEKDKKCDKNKDHRWRGRRNFICKFIDS